MTYSVYEDLDNKVFEWAYDKGIFDHGDSFSQLKKTYEEIDELRDALADGNIEDIKLELGDVIVTLIIQAEMNDLDVVDCLEAAYQKISKRTGKMVDGVFVKDS